MTLTLYETVQRIVHEELGRVRTAELAIVQEQHPHADDSDKDNYACTVRLRDSGIEVNVRDDDPVVELKVDGGKLTLQVDRDGAVALESKGNVELKGSEISIEAQSQL